ncbi:hypothetical protein SteCoe_26108 [Stentor coeruleus]|uniref:cGMP-dependent protein kinase n=1 Tax=Stentor coeruleus TaxID=5963 RepID=A0A1R2BE13_9CILI|nr:hypothetical protein SteCoe_26108 [Stentor coeruleus]
MGNCFMKKEDFLDKCSKISKPRLSHIKSYESMKKSYPVGRGRKSTKPKPISAEDTIDIPQALAIANFTFIDKVKSSTDILIIKESLMKSILFSSLATENQDSIIQNMKFLEVSENQYLMVQGQTSSFFFILVSGKAEVLENNKRVNIIKNKNLIGEISLVNDNFHTSSIRTMEFSSLWSMERRIFRTMIQAINSAEYSQNKCFIEAVPVFSVLTKTQHELILNSITNAKYENGQNIVNEDEPGDLFYIIKEGQVVCSKQGHMLRTMGIGEFFGEQALLYGTPRTATVTATCFVKCLVISRDDLTKALGDQLSQVIYKNTLRIAFEKSKIMKNLNERQIYEIIDKVRISSWNKNTVAIKKGTKKDENLYVVVNGKLEDNLGNTWEVMSILGEKEVVKGIQEEYEDILAVGYVDLATISSKDFNSIIGSNFDKATCNNELLNTFKKITLFRSLSDEKLKILINNLQIEQYEQGKTIFTQGSLGEAFYIIKHGKVDVIIDNNLIRSINKFNYFGERSLLFNELRSATIKAHKTVLVWVLKKSDFLRIIDEHMQNMMQKRIALQDTTVSLDDLILVKILGIGMIGTVYLTSSINSKQLYALKVINRTSIENEKIQDSLSLERKILLQLDHNFILKLIKTFKDEKRIYFLLEYVKGEDLFDVIRNLGLLTDEDAQFYIAVLLIILQHLHELDIVYRDLKPENIMIDEDGYPKLIDFGTAKIVNGRTYTLVGTPHYMAPEVIMGKGYSISADYWSLGIILYEFLCGEVPFAEDSMDTYVIFQKILEGKILYPEYVTLMEDTKNFIEKMLSKNPAIRCGGGWEHVKSHKWFKGYDWEGLFEKNKPSPYRTMTSNLEWEIEKAFKGEKKIYEVLTSEEGNYVMRKSMRNNDWDSEF